MILYAGTIFVSAFLLFLVQPIMAKQILPWFGGSAAVWTTCLVFFQFVLLFGYAYADATTRWLKPRGQVVVHIALLVASLITLPIIPDAGWKPIGDEDPAWRILGLLFITIGLPYFLLSTTGPLVQAWFARTFPTGTVYRLFALSNLASLLALIGYPFLIEPWFTTRVQSYVWSGAYALFVILCAASALFSQHGPAPAERAAAREEAEAPSVPPTFGEYAVWLILSALGSYMLLGVSNHITQNVASVPFLWLLPLTLYLVTFILCFEGSGLYKRRFFLGPVAVALVSMAWGLHADGEILEITHAIPLYAVGLFVCCMFYHGELANLKPSPRYLTRFYLMISLGGAVGGMLVGIVAPKVFSNYWEIGVGLVASGIVGAWVLRALPKWIPALALGVAVACGYYFHEYRESMVRGTKLMTRNFYGSLRVKETGPATDETAMRRLLHGVIMHGEGFIFPGKRLEVTTYYGPTAGVGLAIKLLGDKGPLRVGVIGLGTGTLAGWGREGDVYRFYELDPEVIKVAKEEFFFLDGSKAKIETVVGDARLNLERESPQKFDILVIDAFSSDSIPVHLVTREALAVYQRHMKPDGVIAFHVTNRFLRLSPVVEQLATEQKLMAVHVADEPEDRASSVFARTDWVLVTRNAALAKDKALVDRQEEIEKIPGLRPWTDDYNNLFQILK
jgi:SAM-dependent methyltransferase